MREGDETVWVARCTPQGDWEVGAVAASAPSVARVCLCAGTRGAAVVAWETGDGEVYATCRDGAAWSAPVRVSTPGRGASAPSLAFGPGGGPVCVWVDGAPDVASAWWMGAAWSTPVTVATGSGGVTLPAVAGGPGEWVAVWARADAGIEALVGHPGEGWGEVESISRSGEGSFAPVVHPGVNGDYFAAWVRSGGTVQMARRAGGAGWDAPEDVGAVGEGASGVRFGVAGDGSISVLWTRQRGRIAFARRRPSGAWDAVHTLEEAAWGPRFAGHASGWGVGTWHHGGLVIGATVVDPEGVPGKVKRISRDGEPCRYPSGAIAAAGDAVVAWRRDDGAIQVARHADGSWSEPRDLCDAGGSAEPPRVAVRDDGAALVAWAGRAP